MSHQALITNDQILAKIEESKQWAKEHIYTVARLEFYHKYPDEVPAAENIIYIPLNYLVGFTIECQPIGLINHLSISCIGPRAPSIPAAEEIMRLYDMEPDIMHCENIQIISARNRGDTVNIWQKREQSKN